MASLLWTHLTKMPACRYELLTESRAMSLIEDHFASQPAVSGLVLHGTLMLVQDGDGGPLYQYEVRGWVAGGVKRFAAFGSNCGLVDVIDRGAPIATPLGQKLELPD